MRTCPRCGEGLPERSRFCPGCGAPVAAAQPARERRKVVTVVFADVVGSTALGERVDPETLRWALRHWFERMRAELERHGGRVEKFIGDAVVAVFGLPAVHEDDALRSVRAAAAMRAETERLGAVLREERGVDLAVRIGIATGEAVTGDAAAGGSFATGDVMNLAARLEQAARPGETLLGHETFRLVHHAVEAEPVRPLTLRGKAATVAAHRLLAVASDAAPRRGRPHAPMVGRARERRRLADAFEQAVAERSCQLFTVLGAPGVGKSRLVAEGLQAIGGTSTIAAGRCLPYGDGLTWWPLVEALGHGLLSACERDVPEPVRRVRGLLNGTGAAVAAEDAFWAVRRVLEALARRRPLVLVIDDLQWAEPTFVDLVEHVAEWSRGVPLLLLVMARPELLDHRPGWGGGKVNATSVLLEPLHEHETRDLLGHLLGGTRLEDADAGRIIRVAEGNPLYVEEFVAMLLDERATAADGDGPAVGRPEGVAVPPTIQALLAARLDALADGERAVLEAAAVEGAEFARERVDALLAGRAGGSVSQHLRALVRKDLIRPVAGLEQTFRFRHQLIRDAAYDGLPKAERATLHERFADWLDDRRDTIPAVDELLGYHLEQAVELRRALGATRAATAGLAARAADSLLRAGRRAGARDDPAAVRLLERSAALGDEPLRAEALAELAVALETVGELRRATAVAHEAAELADACGRPATAARARLAELHITMGHTEAAPDLTAFEAAVRPLLDELERLGDDEGLARALRTLAYIHQDHFTPALEYLERAISHAERAKARRDELWAAGHLSMILAYGPVPAREAIARIETLRARSADDPSAHAGMLKSEAVLHAMQGRIEHARELHDEADRIVDELGNRLWAAGAVFTRGTIEELADAPERAEAVARRCLAMHEEMGNVNQGSTAAAFLARALCDQGRFDEALHYADVSAAWAGADDMASQLEQLGVRARVLSHRGDRGGAEASAREAVELSSGTDDIVLRGRVLMDLAHVLGALDRRAEASAALDDAIELFDRKGDLVDAARARALRAELTPRPSRSAAGR